MRTSAEIVARIRAVAKDDFFGFERTDLMAYLPFEDAAQFLQGDDVTPENYAAQGMPFPLERDHALMEMREYMDFAWGKATGHRGLSASRSMSHMRAWLWLLEDDELVAFLDDPKSYPQYGAPVLMAICRKYQIEAPEREDVIRMSQGLPCTPNCTEGCGE